MQPFNFILVPQGQEYKAVMQGLHPLESSTVQVLSIPIGSEYLKTYLKAWLESEAVKNQSSIQVLVLGLCGSLSPHLQIGDIVVYQHCFNPALEGFNPNSPDIIIPCDLDLTSTLHHHLSSSHLVRGFTSKTVIASATEKEKLSQLYPVDVVDMEGLILLKLLIERGIKVAMVRVVSDDFHQNLPDLTSVIGSNGELKTLPLLKVMLQHPIQALNLIRSALKSLHTLQQVAQLLRRFALA